MKCAARLCIGFEKVLTNREFYSPGAARYKDGTGGIEGRHTNEFLMRGRHGNKTPNTGKVVSIARSQERRVAQLAPERTLRIEKVKQINAIGTGLPRIHSSPAIGFHGFAQFSGGFVADPRLIERRIDFDAVLVTQCDTV